MSKLLVFTHSDSTWHRHKAPTDLGSIVCNSRIKLLYYKWGLHYTITEFYVCIDCNRVGIRDNKDTKHDKDYLPIGDTK